jgi:hypothetical protein
LHEFARRKSTAFKSARECALDIANHSFNLTSSYRRLPMERKHLEMAVALLSVAFIVYATLVVRLLHFLSTHMIHGTYSLARAGSPLMANGNVLIFGYHIPVSVICIVGSIWPTWMLASWIRRTILLRHRRKCGLCLECGYPLPTRRGKCPSCGSRYEIERRSNVAYGFSVISAHSSRRHHRCKPAFMPISWS